MSEQRMIRLTGCERYNYQGQLFEADTAYRVDDATARKLLRSKDPTNSDRPFFTEITDMSIVKEPEPEQAVPEEEMIPLKEAEVVDTAPAEEVPIGDVEEVGKVGDNPNKAIDESFDDSDLEEV